ncbi:MAG TPA: DUF3108 domain-containing protein [Vicinamibacterales bacterium]|jgi:Protein of unknown function (DUF3108)|nr:DUF3108 domain-containing protein [Vicinamibacterales bacterium]
MRWLRPLVVYLAAAVVMTWPLALHPRMLLGAPIGPGDPYLNLWILGWGMQAVLSNPASLFDGTVFNANIFFPAKGTLAYSDHLLLQSVVLSPLYAITHDVVLCYNVLLIASLVASALAMQALVRIVVDSEPGAYAAGFAWGFGSYRFAHLIHLQLQSLYFLPLTFLFLHRVIAGRRRRDVVLLGVMAALQAISSIYYGVIGGLALIVGGLALAIGVGRWRNLAVLRRLSVAAVIAGVLVLPVAIVYSRVAQREGFGRNLYEAAQNAAAISSYIHVPPGNVAYARRGVLHAQGPERELFPGFILMALAAFGAWTGWRRDAKATVLAMAAICVVGFVLSLGPDGARTIYAALHRFVFGFAAIRAPARFAVLVLFGLSVLAALGVRALPRRDALPAVAAVLIECLYVPQALTIAPPLQTNVGQWLAHEPAQGPVAVLPIGLDADATPAMVQSLEHRRPIVNGYSGQRPDFYRPLAETINTFPSRESLIALHDLRVRFVVTREPIAPIEPNEPIEPYVERARLAGGTIYQLVWTEELESRLGATATIVPPPAGVIPFKIGELAEYKVAWGGAGVNLSAGDISIAVEGPPYRFVVKATTAPWVARFFEARDVFTTQTDGMLFPRLHERDQNEGSRHVMRAFIYDREAHVVRSGPTVDEARASGAVTLPMLPQARDAIAALFYARTLPPTPGTRVKLPINEAGRNLVVELAFDGLERIPVQGRTVDAIRVTPTMQRRIEDRQAIVSTVWLSNDEHRVPLALDVAAGFGQVHVELATYHP